MTALLEDGLTITAIGMGVVFVLLTLMVFVIRAMSRLSELLGNSTVPMPAAGAVDDAELVGVISAAIRAHRARHGR